MPSVIESEALLAPQSKKVFKIRSQCFCVLLDRDYHTTPFIELQKWTTINVIKNNKYVEVDYLNALDELTFSTWMSSLFVFFCWHAHKVPLKTRKGKYIIDQQLTAVQVVQDFLVPNLLNTFIQRINNINTVHLHKTSPLGSDLFICNFLF